MSKLKIKAKVEGLEALQKRLTQFKQSARNRIVRPGVAKAGRILAKAAKQLAPRDTGLLKRSIGSAVRTYKSGYVLAVIGPRRGFRQQVIRGGKPQMADPVNYAHLVEYGTAHSPARSFLRAAWDGSKKEAQEIIIAEIKKGIDKQLAKQASKR